MSNERVDTASRRGGIDPAALAAASLAAAISVIAPPGPYGPGSMVIGATILVVILAYDVDPHRTPWQSLAFSAVCALISLLVLGYPLEFAFATDKVNRFDVLFREPPRDLGHSEVPPLAVLALWVALTSVYWGIDRRRVRKSGGA
jgi:hypothetical protein